MCNGPCDDKSAPGTDPEDLEGRCVTPYAATKTREDFAKTFMLFMNHRGKIPAKFAKKPAIRKEWKAVPKSCGVSRRGRGRKIAGIGASLVYYSAIRQTPC